MDLSIFFAGTAGSAPTPGRGLPAVFVKRGGEELLFDCGEGTQRQLLRSVGLARLDAVFITHLHADHWLGLPGMLKTFSLQDRTEPLPVYGPPGLARLMDAMRLVYGRTGYEVELIELAPMQAVRRERCEIVAVPVQHGERRCLGYALVEDQRPGEFDPQAAQALGIAPGPDFGRLQRGEEVAGVRPEQVMGAPRQGRKVVISGDTVPCETIAFAAHEADLLVHEATFLEADRERALETGHSTALQAGEVAARAGVRMLALTHVSQRNTVAEALEEARLRFPATEAPRDFDTIEIPFAEHGGPQLVTWAQRRGAHGRGSPAAPAEGGGARDAGEGDPAKERVPSS